MKDYPKFLFFKPYLKKTLWAGNNLQSYYQSDAPIGEAWLLSAYPQKQSQCLNPEYYLLNLEELFLGHQYLFQSKLKTYPNLLKIIDTAQSLSLQVHPDNDYALKNYQSLGKDECWYVLKAGPEPFLIGLEKLDPATFKKALFEQKLLPFSKKKVLLKDDFLYLKAGLVHALGAQSTVFELQQASDLTFRVDDFKRLDLDGKLRPLHLEKAYQTIKLDYQASIIKTQSQKSCLLVSNNYFHLSKIVIDKPQKITLKKALWYEIVIIKGEGKIDQQKVKKYSSCILTHGFHHFYAQGKMVLLINANYH